MFRFASPFHRQLEPELQSIEVWSAMAIPSFRVVGLPGPEIIESCERVRAAIEASQIPFPRRRVLVNLSPAGVRKQGTGTDLAIALAIGSPEQLQSTDHHPHGLIVASGELALNGAIRSAGRVLRTLVATMNAGAQDLVLATEDLNSLRKSAHLLRNVPDFCGRPWPRIHLAGSLTEAIRSLRNRDRIFDEDSSASETKPPTHDGLLPLHQDMERTLLASAAGAHHLLLIGPKGTGKTAALQWMRVLQAKLSPSQLLERLLLQELVYGNTETFDNTAPVRVLPPQVRPEALIGGIYRGELRPGEFSQAHGGTLIADEFLEWPRDSRESLRDPMETGEVHLVRAQRNIRLPARFQLAASANLCRCGGWPRAWSKMTNLHRVQAKPPIPCQCSYTQRAEYLSRLSGPLLDRIDIVKPTLGHPFSVEDRKKRASPEALFAVTEQARAVLRQNWGSVSGRLSATEMEQILKQQPRIEAQWGQIRRPRAVSLRRRHKEIRVALTLAALDQALGKATEPIPENHHFQEAVAATAESWLTTLAETPIRNRVYGGQKTLIDREEQNP